MESTPCLILARIITFSPPPTRSKPPSLEALYSFPPFHSLYKFHVSCFVLFSHFISLPPASLSLLLHFNCDFHGYRTRSRSTCIKCPAGINLLLVLTEPRLFGQGYPGRDLPLTVRNSLTTTDCKKELKLYFLSLN